MDEAGYGPNLGPLLLTVTCWQVPGLATEFDFPAALTPIVSTQGTDNGQRLHIADSKQVFVGKQGFASLERSALALLRAAGVPVQSFHQLWNHLTGNADGHIAKCAPWYHDDLLLPVVADAGHIDQLSGLLIERMNQTGVTLCSLQGDVVVEERFNQLATAIGSNKSLALSRLALALLKRVWQDDGTCPTLFVGDKHGGRNRYDELLAEIADGLFITRLEEGRVISRYRIGNTELRFQMKGEQHLPVACASIIAKYVRELAMDQFNLFWGKQCDGVKPTRGYPVDAKRFRMAIEPAMKQLEIDESLLWRKL